MAGLREKYQEFKGGAGSLEPIEHPGTAPEPRKPLREKYQTFIAQRPDEKISGVAEGEGEPSTVGGRFVQHVATGIGSGVIGGGKELMALMQGKTGEEAAAVMRDYRARHTYQPPAGSDAAKLVNSLEDPRNPGNLPANLINKGIEFLGRHGMPAGAAILEGVAGVSPIIAPIAGKFMGKNGATSAATTEPLPVPGTLRDAGAAATDIANQAAALGAPADLVATITNAHPEASITAIQNHIAAQTLPVPISLTRGQALRDVGHLTDEYNHGGFGEHYNQQLKDLMANREAIREIETPDIYSTNHVEKGQDLIELYKKLDAPKKEEIGQAYQELRDAYNEGDFPVDFSQLHDNTMAALKQDFALADLPASITGILGEFKSGRVGDFNDFEKLRSKLGRDYASHKRSYEGDSQAKAHAINIVRQQLDALPLNADAEYLRPVADKARGLARARFAELEKDPAYKAAVEDSVFPDQFMQKFVLKPKAAEHVRQMRQNLGEFPEAQQLMASAWLDELDRASGKVGDNEKFNQHSFTKALDKINHIRADIFTPETSAHLQNLADTARNTQEMPRGATPNYSGSGILIKKYFEDMAAHAAGLPGAHMAFKLIKSAINDKEKQKYFHEATRPGAGIKQKGEK